MEQGEKEKEMKCPANCSTIDPDSKLERPGMLTESIPGNDRWFCLNSRCKFAFQDENKKDHWIGGVIPLNFPVVNH